MGRGNGVPTPFLVKAFPLVKAFLVKAFLVKALVKAFGEGVGEGVSW